MDEQSFDALYEREWPALVGALTLVCGNRTEAADCVQEAFVRAWENRRRLDDDAGGWVRAVALRIAVSRWRKARNSATAWLRDHRQREATYAVADTGQVLDADVWQGLMSLPDAQREALVMHHVLDLSVAELAAATGAPVGTVKARLARGRAAMAARLTSHGQPSWREVR